MTHVEQTVAVSLGSGAERLGVASKSRQALQQTLP